VAAASCCLSHGRVRWRPRPQSWEIPGHRPQVPAGTSDNFSHSAEFHNVEFGIKIDNSSLAESVEREMRRAEDDLYERIS
jgi:hypothetical protein